MNSHRMLLRCCAYVCAANLAFACPARSQSAVGPAAPLPSYPDETSAYSVIESPTLPAQLTPVPDAPPVQVDNSPDATQPAPTTPTRHRVQQTSLAATTTAAPPTNDPRRLAPPSASRAVVPGLRDRPRDPSSFGPSLGLPLNSIYTTLTALAVVVGLFLGCAWLVRRGQKKSKQLLPESVVSVLGRVPLATRQFAELVRVGNKLVLLSITPHGIEPITEVTDPVEIDRLLGLCQQGNSRSTTAEFDQVFRQLADEPAPGGFLGGDVAQFGPRTAADPFAAYRGGLRA